MYFFSIPDSFFCRTNSKILLYGMKEHPEWFYDDFKIETAYGCPPACIWNGNRNEFGNVFPPRNWVYNVIRSIYRPFGVRYRLTFTNFLLKPVHLCDLYANKIAEEVAKTNAYAMVSTQMMYDYMAEKYPALTLCWSTTTDFGKSREEQIKKINELSAKNLVVLPYDFNNTPELDLLQYSENIEVLVNEKCIVQCPIRREHWASQNRYNLFQIDNQVDCPYIEELQNPNIELPHLVPREKLEDYARRGIYHFKIEGRINPVAASQAFKEWLVRPEFWMDYDDYGNECNKTNFGESV